MQLAIMLLPTILATSILSVPSITMHYAGHDMWLSPIWGSLVGFIVIGISLGIYRLYPNMTIIQSSVKILGWLPGKVFGLAYLVYLPHLTGLIIREYGEFIVNNALPRTPLFIVMGTMVIVCSLNVRLGIEVVGRTSQIFVTIITALLLLTFLLLMKELKPEELLPVFEDGVLPSFLGSIAPAAWLSEYMVIAFLLPYVNHKRQLGKVMMGSLLFTTAIMIVTNLVCLFLIGDITDSFAFPMLIAARYITIADFLQHIEAVIIAVWIFGIFVKISVFLYIFATTTAEWFGLDDYKPVVAPLSFLCLAYSYWVVTGQSDVAKLLSVSGNLYTLLFLFCFPALLYGCALLRKLWNVSMKGRGA
ncbi:spore germination protein KB [Paenibacillus cellulosilyticus]|uniref:Spore germination protein KB n=1 Tax=Paenibacillus cellulosilyticus TaxID=375489 RepID=A0A2V2YX54_9BACL|nr:endospore germination permease [Paenibacillus cellulosilyticus]PWW04768.1 spore germination protein KB [Paenibacillus cellulosilyticus]QKS45891.1 endospore germination permease [Paenibacillus cellulosilyticus]